MILTYVKKCYCFSFNFLNWYSKTYLTKDRFQLEKKIWSRFLNGFLVSWLGFKKWLILGKGIRARKKILVKIFKWISWILTRLYKMVNPWQRYTYNAFSWSLSHFNISIASSGWRCIIRIIYYLLYVDWKEQRWTLFFEFIFLYPLNFY